MPGAKRLAKGASAGGPDLRGLAAWERTTLEAPGRPAIEITATPCRHGPPLSHPIVGEVVGFALRWEGQEHGALWISGDTVLYDGVREVAARVAVGTALLHLGGVRFPISGPLRYTMTGAEAVELCGQIRPRTAIPIHYEGWKHFREGREEVERALAAAPAEVRDCLPLARDRRPDRDRRLSAPRNRGSRLGRRWGRGRELPRPRLRPPARGGRALPLRDQQAVVEDRGDEGADRRRDRLRQGAEDDPHQRPVGDARRRWRRRRGCRRRRSGRRR